MLCSCRRATARTARRGNLLEQRPGLVGPLLPQTHEPEQEHRLRSAGSSARLFSSASDARSRSPFSRCTSPRSACVTWSSSCICACSTNSALTRAKRARSPAAGGRPPLSTIETSADRRTARRGSSRACQQRSLARPIPPGSTPPPCAGAGARRSGPDQRRPRVGVRVLSQVAQGVGLHQRPLFGVAAQSPGIGAGRRAWPRRAAVKVAARSTTPRAARRATTSPALHGPISGPLA